MSDFSKTFSVGEGLSFGDDVVGILFGTDNPSVVGQIAPTGTLFIRTDGTLFQKIGSPDIDWRNISKYDDVIEFGEGGKGTKNKFIKSAYSNHTSLASTALALGDGRVLHTTISTEEKPENGFFAQIITNAIKGGVGSPIEHAGGTQIGADLVKPVGVLDKIQTELTGYEFSAGDRIAIYIKEGPLVILPGSPTILGDPGKAMKPVIRLFVQYD